ncbi:MAG: HD domain-containing protein [Treponema sp.]|nr:HD domain-containing protein [Treponema sp.]MCL2252273.1 HD domain-containing protein [Treponema sp.]
MKYRTNIFSMLRQRIFVILENEPKREDKLSRFINQALLCLIGLNIIAVIISILIDLPVTLINLFYYFELFSIIIFTIEYLLRLWVDPYKPEAKHGFLSKLPVYLRFIFSPMGLIDLIAILPFYLPFIVLDFRLLRLLRLVRLLRIFKLYRYDRTLKMISKVLDNALQGLANVIEYRDKESGEHVKRTQLYVKALIDYLIDNNSVYSDELRKLQPEIIIKSMALHDVGKIAIPDRILLKPDKLDPDEYEIMKTHAVRGKAIIHEMGDAETSIYLKHCEDICNSHHERYDGKGYPDQLKENEIPLTARLAALADVYDALVCPRVYKPAISYEKAAGIIIEGRGTHFDPVITDAFTALQDQFKEIAEKYK